MFNSSFPENFNDQPCNYGSFMTDFEDRNYYNNQDYLNISDYVDMEASEYSTYSFNPCFTQEMTSTGSTSSSLNGVTENRGMQVESKREMKRAKVDDYNEDDEQVVTFRCKTKLEIMDDGYKWRKYGKKKVKSNSNPRNYYKCLHPGCKVKKRVERDGEDCSYVITSYEGVHNHESPSTIHCNSTLPCQWILQDSQYYG